mgnify:CR=1 FL=1
MGKRNTIFGFLLATGLLLATGCGARLVYFTETPTPVATASPIATPVPTLPVATATPAPPVTFPTA